MVKSPSANSGDIRDSSSIPGLGRSPGEGNGNPPQYSCLQNFTEGEAWWATVHRVTELDTTKATYHTRTHTNKINKILKNVIRSYYDILF